MFWVVFWVFTIYFVALFASYFVYMKYLLKRKANKIDHPDYSTVEGTVEEVRHDSQGDLEWTVASFTYEVNGNQYSGHDIWDKAFKQQTVTVYYSPENPEENSLNPWVTKPIIDFHSLIFLGLLFAGFVAIDVTAWIMAPIPEDDRLTYVLASLVFLLILTCAFNKQLSIYRKRKRLDSKGKSPKTEIKL